MNVYNDEEDNSLCQVIEAAMRVSSGVDEIPKKIIVVQEKLTKMETLLLLSSSSPSSRKASK
jgi:hypothetical protein